MMSNRRDGDLREGEPAPDFLLPGPEGEVRLSDLLGNGPVVVAFYQEDDTPGCRAQLGAFRDDHDVLAELGGRLVAISTDSPASHRAFAERLGAPFPLLSDEDGAVARAYGVYDEQSRRAHRAVFVIGAGGVLLLSIPWYNPANPSQFEQVFQALGMI